MQQREDSLVLTFFKRFTCFSLPVLLVVLESFAGIKPAARSTGERRPELLQITLLPVYLGPKLGNLLQTHTNTNAHTHTQKRKSIDKIVGTVAREKQCVWFRKQAVLRSCFHLF